MTETRARILLSQASTVAAKGAFRAVAAPVAESAPELVVTLLLTFR